MSATDPHDTTTILARVRAQAAGEQVELSAHARQQMARKGIAYDEVRETLLAAQLLENYPSYHKGACALLYGDTVAGRPLHVVCSTTGALLTIITAYEPEPPRWVTPTERGR